MLINLKGLFTIPNNITTSQKQSQDRCGRQIWKMKNLKTYIEVATFLLDILD